MDQPSPRTHSAVNDDVPTSGVSRPDKFNATTLWRPSLVCIFATIPPQVHAHASERGFILLLPTHYYLAGGTLAVLASVILVALLRSPVSATIKKWRYNLPLPAVSVRDITSLLSTLLLLGLVLAGYIGNTDPLDNPLPLTVWTIFWVLTTIAHAAFGNLWAYLNPWTGLAHLCGFGKRGIIQLPGAGYWLAILLFLVFAWFELVSLSPEDPETLATAVLLYWTFTVIAIALFGSDEWMRRAEPFAVFFYFVSLLSPLTRRKAARRTPGRMNQQNNMSDQQQEQCNAVQISLPGLRILEHPAIHWSAALFILLTLSSVSFDGLNKSFWWLHLHHINPLAFEGRSSVTWINTRGLLLSALVLCSAYAGSVWLGWKLSRSNTPLQIPIALFALAIIPISLGYHLAHYLTQVLVNGQYTVIAFADPFATGLDLWGVRSNHVTTSFLSNHDAVSLLWKLQVTFIVCGHIASVVIAHLLSLKLYPGKAVIGQLPMALLMVLYTLFGLWLLSTPTGL